MSLFPKTPFPHKFFLSPGPCQATPSRYRWPTGASLTNHVLPWYLFAKFYGIRFPQFCPCHTSSYFSGAFQLFSHFFSLWSSPLLVVAPAKFLFPKQTPRGPSTRVSKWLSPLLPLVFLVSPELFSLSAVLLRTKLQCKLQSTFMWDKFSFTSFYPLLRWLWWVGLQIPHVSLWLSPHCFDLHYLTTFFFLFWHFFAARPFFLKSPPPFSADSTEASVRLLF